MITRMNGKFPNWRRRTPWTLVLDARLVYFWFEHSDAENPIFTFGHNSEKMRTFIMYLRQNGRVFFWDFAATTARKRSGKWLPLHSSIRPQFPFGWNWFFSDSDSDVTKIWEAASTWHLPKLLAINRANRDLASSWIELYVSAKIPTLSAKKPSLKNQSKNLVWPAVSFATCVQKCALHLLGPSITKVNSCWMQTNSTCTHYTYSFVIF